MTPRDMLVQDAHAGSQSALRLLWRVYGIRLPLVEGRLGVSLDGVPRFSQPFDRDTTLDTMIPGTLSPDEEEFSYERIEDIG
jgi:hypothetical protein